MTEIPDYTINADSTLTLRAQDQEFTVLCHDETDDLFTVEIPGGLTVEVAICDAGSPADEHICRIISQPGFLIACHQLAFHYEAEIIQACNLFMEIIAAPPPRMRPWVK